MVTDMSSLADKLKEVLSTKREPVGVKFLSEQELGKLKATYDRETKTRYCQALMRASQGEKTIISAENISCPASAAAFGLKPLTEMLSSGKMLYGMGLFSTPEAGKKAMEGMTRLEQGAYQAVLVSPLVDMEVHPDVIVVESEPEHLMWVALASIYKTGQRLEFSSAIFQATCVDCTVLPFVTKRVNASLGCYGCRDATNMQESECLIGIPSEMIDEVVENLESLSQKALPKARGKEAYHSFSGCGE